MSYRPERVCTGSSKNPTEYIREDIVQEMLKEQREEFEDFRYVAKQYFDNPSSRACRAALENALTTVEKENEKESTFIGLSFRGRSIYHGEE